MAKEREKVFAVIGLGSFGERLCEELSEKGGKVLAIDNQAKLIERVKDMVAQSILLDSTDEEAMNQVPFADVDTAVVAIGDNIEASILTTAILKRIGIPRILSRAVSEIHQQVLWQVGADEIINIEIDEGTRLAQRLISPEILDRIPISEKISLSEVFVPSDFAEKNLSQLDLRNKMHVNVVAIRRTSLTVDEEGDTVRSERIVFPDAETKLEESDVLLLVGLNEDLDSFRSF